MNVNPDISLPKEALKASIIPTSDAPVRNFLTTKQRHTGFYNGSPDDVNHFWEITRAPEASGWCDMSHSGFYTSTKSFCLSNTNTCFRKTNFCMRHTSSYIPNIRTDVSKTSACMPDTCFCKRLTNSCISSYEACISIYGCCISRYVTNTSRTRALVNDMAFKIPPPGKFLSIPAPLYTHVNASFINVYPDH